jgi:glycosyltransferase involved in cell wall biosynthesis
MEADALAAVLAACDVVIQPYTDGVTTRRGSVMASLALGIPIVTTTGDATEPIWAQSNAVVLAEHDADALAVATDALLEDVGRRRALSERGRNLYDGSFSLACTLQTLSR